MISDKILLLEPYYGGSHQLFLEGLVKHVPAHYVLMSLPARKWKMRMQLSAPWFVSEIEAIPERDRWFDIVLASTFMDVAVFRSLVSNIKGWNPNTRYYTYFHENQFTYPGVLPKKTTHQFTAINFTTALASDHIGFNSRYNRDSFMDQCDKYLKKAADMDLRSALTKISNKSVVLYPGLDFQGIDRAKQVIDPGIAPLIIWNHRWEHDKNPEEFFHALYRLDDEGISFKLAVLGQGFRERPTIFSDAADRLHHLIVHFGFVEDRQCYYEILKSGSFIVSTALHEFFGISILEGVRAGCYPIVPDRLSYPELFESSFRYKSGTLYQTLKKHITNRSVLSGDQNLRLTANYSWTSIAEQYLEWFQ